MELSAARVFVREISAAQQFYQQKLGLPLKTDGCKYGFCVFDTGSTELVVETVPDDAPEEDKIMVGRFTGLSFKVDDAAAKCKELQARDVHFTGLPEKQFWGGILATFQDPAGNQLQIVQLPVAT